MSANLVPIRLRLPKVPRQALQALAKRSLLLDELRNELLIARNELWDAFQRLDEMEADLKKDQREMRLRLASEEMDD